MRRRQRRNSASFSPQAVSNNAIKTAGIHLRVSYMTKCAGAMQVHGSQFSGPYDNAVYDNGSKFHLDCSWDDSLAFFGFLLFVFRFCESGHKDSGTVSQFDLIGWHRVLQFVATC
jgi:hypothetical protein